MRELTAFFQTGMKDMEWKGRGKTKSVRAYMSGVWKGKGRL